MTEVDAHFAADLAKYAIYTLLALAAAAVIIGTFIVWAVEIAI